MRYIVSLLVCSISFEVQAASRVSALISDLQSTQTQLTAVRADHAVVQQRATALEADLGRVDGAVRNAFHTLGQHVPPTDRSTTDVLEELVAYVTAAAAVPPALVAQVDTLLTALKIAPAGATSLHEKLGLVQTRLPDLTDDLARVRGELEASQRTISQLTAERDEARATATGLASENAAAVQGLRPFVATPIAGRTLAYYVAGVGPVIQAKSAARGAAEAGLMAAEHRLAQQVTATEDLQRRLLEQSAVKRREYDAATRRMQDMEARMAALEARALAAERQAIASDAVAAQALAAAREEASAAEQAKEVARQAVMQVQGQLQQVGAELVTLREKAAEVTPLRRQVGQLQGQVAEAENRVAALQEQHVAQTRDLGAAREALAAAQAEVAANGASAQAAASRIAELESAVAGREAECTRLATALAAATAQHAAQEAELNTQLRTVRAQMEGIERNLSSARRHQDSAQRRVLAAEARAEQVDAQYRENELAMQQSHASQMQALEAQCTAVSNALASLEASHVDQDRQIAAKQQECQDLQEQIAALTQKDGVQVAEIVALNDHKQKLEAQIRQLQDKNAVAIRELEQLQGANKRYLEAQKQLETLQSANTTLRTASQAATGEVTALSLRLQETQRLHIEHLETLRREHDQVIARLKEESASNTQGITKRFESAMATLVAEQKAALVEACAAKDFNAAAIDELQKKYDQDVAALNAEKQEALRQQSEASKAVLRAAEARHAQAMEDLTKQLSAQAARITALMDSEKSLKALSAKANETKNALAGQLAALQGQFEAQVAANAEDKKALTTLNLRHAIAKRILSKRGNKVQELTQEIAQLKSSLSTTTVQKTLLDGQVAALTAKLEEQTRISRTQADEIARQVAALAGKDGEITLLQAAAQQSAERLLAAQKEFATKQQEQAEQHADALRDLKASQASELDGLTISHRAAQASLTAQIAEAKDEKASLETRYGAQEQTYESAQSALKAQHREAIQGLEEHHKALIETLTARLASQGQEYSQQVAALEARFSAKEAALQEQLAAVQAGASAAAAAQTAKHEAALADALEVLRLEHAVVLDQLRVENVRLASELSAVKTQLETALAKAADDRRVNGDAIASARATHAQLQQAVTEAQEALRTESAAHAGAQVARKLAFAQEIRAAAQSRSQQATIHALQEKLEAFQASLASIKGQILVSDEDEQALGETAAVASEDATPQDVFAEVVNYYAGIVAELNARLRASEVEPQKSGLQAELESVLAIPFITVDSPSYYDGSSSDLAHKESPSVSGDIAADLTAVLGMPYHGQVDLGLEPAVGKPGDAIGMNLAALLDVPFHGSGAATSASPLKLVQPLSTGSRSPDENKI